jgi:hypothetical protein
MKAHPLPIWLVIALATASLAQAKPDGALDTTFSGDGWDFWNPSFATGVKVEDLAVRPDGQLAITGRVFAVGDRDALSCVRFGNGGGGTCVNLTYDLGGGNNNDGNGIAVQSDNKTVIVGAAQGPPADTAWVTTVQRMTSANALDGTFNGGTGAFDLSSTYDVGAEAVTVAGDKIYLAGSVGVDVGGGDGVADFAYGATDDISTVVDVAALTPPSDRIAILGDYDPAGTDPIDSFLVVVTLAGSLDTTFNGTGKRSLAPTSGDPWSHAQGLAVQAGRLVVLGGYHPTTASVNLAWLARVQMSLIFGDDFDAGHLGLWSSVAP